MSARVLDAPAPTPHEHTWRLDDVDFDCRVGQVTQFSCSCGEVLYR